MVKAILGRDDAREVGINLTNLTSASKFWKSYERIAAMIVNSSNDYYINPADKRNLITKRNPLERNMLSYLLHYDPLFHQLRNNSKGIRVYTRQFFMGFGLIQLSLQQVQEF